MEEDFGSGILRGWISTEDFGRRFFGGGGKCEVGTKLEPAIHII